MINKKKSIGQESGGREIEGESESESERERVRERASS